MNPASNRLFWMYQKNKHLIDALLLHRAPRFVYQWKPSAIKGEIPVITFHLALTDWFDEQCQHLALNNYYTLSTCEFNERIQQPDNQIEKNVFITFDDGLKHVWTVAYPLLKKYGLRATCYLIPGLIPESDDRIRPTLEDVWKGEASEQDVMGFHKDEPALCTWNEIKIMHESGVIDFQSHTMNHALVPVSSEITDFVHPGYDSYYYGNIHTPLYTQNGEDVVSRDPILGMPIYKSSPRMQADLRYFDDEGLRTHCIEIVQQNGGRAFYNSGDWESTLRQTVAKYQDSYESSGRYETPEQRDEALYTELLSAKLAIEEKLPGKKVTQLCYPWYDASEHAIQASKKAGYSVNLFGQRDNRYTNTPGEDTFEIVRVEELFLQRLPGKGRKNLWQTFLQMYRMRSLPTRLFPEGRLGIV